MVRKCLNCQKEFIVCPAIIKRGQGIYCSIKCVRGDKFYRAKKGLATIRQWENPIVREKMLKKHYRISWEPKGRKKEVICTFCGKTFMTPNYRRAKYCSNRCGSKANWMNKEYREKMIKSLLRSLNIRPTSLEKQMIDLTQKHNLPYRYTGDGSFLIGGKNPDFVNINGEKKLIEVGNVFHHQGDYIEKRREHFARYGWQSYIFIGDELDEKEIIKQLKIDFERG